jgi:hypothetical protein
LNHIVKKLFNKSKTKSFGEIWVSFSIVGKALVGFVGGDFIIFRPKGRGGGGVGILKFE